MSGHLLGRAASLPREERIAVGFSGSQKTLMIGLEVALTYFDHLPLAMLPALALAHWTAFRLDPPAWSARIPNAGFAVLFGLGSALALAFVRTDYRPFIYFQF